MLFLTVLSGVSVLPPQSPPLPEALPQYLPFVLGSVAAIPPVGASCRGPPSGLRFVPVFHWWGELGEHWILGTTSISCSTPLSADHSPLMTWSPLPISSPCIYCPTSRPLGTFTSTSCALAGLPWDSFPGWPLSVSLTVFTSLHPSTCLSACLYVCFHFSYLQVCFLIWVLLGYLL